ncbi:MAG: hypothetical protein V3V19_09315 [Cocleimonas sp.]
MQNNKLYRSILLAVSVASGSVFLSACDDEKSSLKSGGNPPASAPLFKYEIWGTDQSNQTAGATALGTKGSAMYIWDGSDVVGQINGGDKAKPMGCGADADKPGMGPCQMEAVFPGALTDETGTKLSTKFGAGFARMHGSLPDPQQKYMNINMFKTGGDGGFVGIMDARTKVAVALWQVAKTGKSAGGRSVHMSFWNKDGSALFVANLHGRIMERIDITRDSDGNIVNANFNRSAAYSAGSGTTSLVLEPSHAYSGKNALGGDLISTISGDYNHTGITTETLPNGECKENGCATGTTSAKGGRPGGVIICPIVSDTGMGYLTFGAGGAIVVDTKQTPMTAVAAYGNEELNGAGCGGIHIDNKVWLDGGVSAVGAGAPRSTFTVYTVDDTKIAIAANKGEFLDDAKKPQITTVFKDATNTAASGNVGGVAENLTGQIPGISTRRDAHGMIETSDDKYVHVVDRIQNVMEVFDAKTEKKIGSYDLTSADGKGTGDGPCKAASITDGNLVSSGDAMIMNDPAPDLMGITPDGKYIVVALRGPKPVTVNHGGQGSCPGVGVIELTEGGASGKLIAVLRTSNTKDDSTPPNFAGGANYIGAEAADVHGASARMKVK